MPWLCYIVTIPDIWVAMKFTEWHIVRVHLVQWSTNLLELHNAWYMPVFQLSPFSFFVFNTFCFTIATFILGPIYLIVLWSGDFLGEGTSTWFVIYALFDEVFKTSLIYPNYIEIEMLLSSSQRIKLLQFKKFWYRI